MAKAKQQKADVLAELRKRHGPGVVFTYGDKPLRVDTISTGARSLDAALGVGGLPRGRVVEIYGPESSGKTTLALHVMANAQRAKGKVAIVDAEHALDPNYARAIGVDMRRLVVSQPDHGEQALDVVDMLATSGEYAVIVVDSVAALVPQKELEGDMGASHVGLHARLMSQAMRKLTRAVASSGTCVIFINQIRMKIGVMFGSPETTTGGNALKYYASVRLDIRRIATIKEGTAARGSRTRVKVVKNKLAPPFRQAEFDILYGYGIDAEGCLLEAAVELGVVEKSGSWFSFQGARLGQGHVNVVEQLRSQPELVENITAVLDGAA